MIQCVSVGPLGENVYIVDKPGAPVVVFDPGAEPERLALVVLGAVERSKAESVAVVLTHGHLDHTAGVSGLLSALAGRGAAVRVYAPEGDRAYFGEAAWGTNGRLFQDIGARAFMGQLWAPVPEADEYYGDGFVVPGTDMRAIHTPGHTPGSSCFLVEGALVAGDTLFRDGRGRTDGFDSDEGAILLSIRDRLLVLPEATVVWPGHGPRTTIGREKRNY